MNIEATGYKIEMSEQELWLIAFSLKHDMEDTDKALHSAQHYGMKTFMDNYGKYLDIYQNICSHLGRLDIYNETVLLIGRTINEAIEGRK